MLLSCGLFARIRCVLAACYEVYVCCEIIGRIHEGVIRIIVKEYNQEGHDYAGLQPPPPSS